MTEKQLKTKYLLCLFSRCYEVDKLYVECLQSCTVKISVSLVKVVKLSFVKITIQNPLLTNQIKPSLPPTIHSENLTKVT